MTTLMKRLIAVLPLRGNVKKLTPKHTPPSTTICTRRYSSNGLALRPRLP
jgi:hypothetical protein